ncbi:hypothetical protein POSPLADRAFT_1145696 [Postia placenta MAD-698-R-SB12]|uniref:Uncharacterized protein n=1 Tax=Postia placenta MAD-698-R-SB12 TaxID=670580 RepID=A0A1X6MXY8_9APHY|nr:hypothetical protein POSPLADRAFT_1145696 [Postia placenta MAD-698-R-SB12]OSX61207.1 hypothetical protein POSPLADRAFT_1145696 [Postia placenta MAD-698-R-SB12]
MPRLKLTSIKLETLEQLDTLKDALKDEYSELDIYVENVWIRFNPAYSDAGKQIEDEHDFKKHEQREIVHRLVNEAEIRTVAIDITLLSNNWLLDAHIEPKHVLFLQSTNPLKVPHLHGANFRFLWCTTHLLVDMPWNQVVECLPPADPTKPCSVSDEVVSHAVITFFESIPRLTHLCIRIVVGNMVRGACPIIKWLHEILYAARHLRRLVIQCVDDATGSSCSQDAWRWLNQQLVCNKLYRVNLLPFSLETSDLWDGLLMTGGFEFWEKTKEYKAQWPLK